MGKGGQKLSKIPNVERKLKLEHMPTEELRKWAKAYGVDSEKERIALLKELVRNIF